MGIFKNFCYKHSNLITEDMNFSIYGYYHTFEKVNYPTKTLSQFKKDLNYIVSNYTDVNISFDDGLKGVLDVLPVLEEFHIQATFFINSSLVGSYNRMNKSDIRNLIKKGHIIGNHGANHYDFRRCNMITWINEFEVGKRWIENELGISNPPYAFPYSDKHATDFFIDWILDKYPNTVLYGNGGFKKDKKKIIHRIGLDNPSYGAEHIIKAEILYQTINEYLFNGTRKRRRNDNREIY